MQFPKGYGLGYGIKVTKGSAGFKPPLLVVGANNYMRNLTATLGDSKWGGWDTHVLFFPTADNIYRAGILGVSRHDSQVFLTYAEGNTVDEAIQNAFKSKHNSIELAEHALLWLNNSVYRCPKIALKDLLSLDAFKKTA